MVNYVEIPTVKVLNDLLDFSTAFCYGEDVPFVTYSKNGQFVAVPAYYKNTHSGAKYFKSFFIPTNKKINKGYISKANRMQNFKNASALNAYIVNNAEAYNFFGIHEHKGKIIVRAYEKPTTEKDYIPYTSFSFVLFNQYSWLHVSIAILVSIHLYLKTGTFADHYDILDNMYITKNNIL